MKQFGRLIRVFGERINIPNPISHVTKEAARIAKLSSTQTGIQKVSILDLGFGLGNHWSSVGADFPGTGVEIDLTAFDAVVNGTQGNSFPQPKDYLQGLAPNDLAGIPGRSFDMVIAFDLIEHLSKADGYLLLYQMERISSHSAIIFTPNGHVWQPPSPDNPKQAHLSGWSPSEFARLGWKTRLGATGLRGFFGPYAAFKPRKQFGFLRTFSVLLSRLALLLPSLAYSFVAIHYTKDRPMLRP